MTSTSTYIRQGVLRLPGNDHNCVSIQHNHREEVIPMRLEPAQGAAPGLDLYYLIVQRPQ